MELQKFWNAMDTALTSTLIANQGLRDDDTLMNTFLAMETLVPPLGHTQRNQGMSSYKNFTRVLRDHLLKKEIISKETSAKAYKYLIKNQLDKDGFDILTRIIIKGSAQLGGGDLLILV